MHRWINISAISLNVSMLVLPIYVFAIYQLIKSKETVFAIISIITISLILFLQPDASQLAGFTFAMLFCLFNKENRNNTNTIVRIITSLTLIIFTVLAWNLSVNL